MRFGTHPLPLSPTADDDLRVIGEQLDQIELADRLGFEHCWLTEHLLSGESGFGDPIPLAGAISQRTSRIRVGFAVLQMALTHPTRVFLQANLLDNLLEGRLTLGIGRGSAFNEYEYVAFGARSDGQRERMFEALDLLERAWARDASPFAGEFFSVSIPDVRPRPVQQPHPPIVLSVLSDETLRWAAGRGYGVMMPRLPVERARERLGFYRRAMAEADVPETAAEQALERSTLLRSIYVADSDEQAEEEVREATFRLHAHLQRTRQGYNPTDVDNRALAQQNASPVWSSPESTPEEAVASLMSRGFILGSPETVRSRIAELEEAGVRGLMITFTWGDMGHERVLRSMSRFAAEVMPHFAREPAASAARD
ncbi:MAG: LLM class flavin-dependent oxidoreductase [Chloroflexi bacterium]|nr:LLM class flavin-dependent oxidoreductase [Chloroflexota bacterium]